MKEYKAIIISLILAVLPFNSAFAILGFGIQGGQSMFTVGERGDSRLLTAMPETYANFETASFSDPFSFGVYVYLDFIPFIDIDIDMMLNAQKYQFSFENPIMNVGPMEAYWGGASTYITARKKLLGLELPILGGAQLFAGGGYNMHSFAPLVNLDLVESLMNGELGAEPQFDEKQLIAFIKDNKVDKTGFHLQGGMKFQLFMLDAFMFYRHTIGEFEDIIDAKTYGSINVRVGMGF
ncbi:MAG: hypothetical protein P8L91_01070 [Candidatus Marinimicrobia bacterium]|nr:hypothetical protein [Candidatus Neomarinimicrobiota bacterium]